MQQRVRVGAYAVCEQDGLLRAKFRVVEKSF